MAATPRQNFWSRLLPPADAVAAKAAEVEAEALRRRLLARASGCARDRGVAGAPTPARAGAPSRAGALEAVPCAPGVAATSPTCCAPAWSCSEVPEAQAAAYRPRPPPLWPGHRRDPASPPAARRRARRPGRLAAFLPPPRRRRDPARALRCRAAVATGTPNAGLELARAMAPSSRSDRRLDGDPNQPAADRAAGATEATVQVSSAVPA